MPRRRFKSELLVCVLFLAACPHPSATDAGIDAGTPPADAGGSMECAVRGERAPCSLPGVSGTCCSGACVDVSHDALNCDFCGRGCFVGWTCEFGACTAPSGSDGGGVCPAGTAWSESYLACLPTRCSDDTTNALCEPGDAGYGFCCGSTCATDCAQCGLTCGGGTCGFAYSCGPGVSCGLSAVCTGACPTGTLETINLGDRAICTSTDCGSTSEGEGLPCAFTAASQTRSGICCNGACVNEQTDALNCGVCGNACPNGSFCDFAHQGGCPLVSCVGASAETPCVLDAGVTGSCCGDLCLDEEHDETACGRCGISCPVGGDCEYGNCRRDDAGFFGCDADPFACPQGTRCVGNDCRAIACGVDGEQCAFGNETGECCSGQCTDPLHDPENCGRCGVGSKDGVCLEGNAFPIPYDAGVPMPCIGAFGWGHIGPYCDDPDCSCIQGVPPGIGCVTIPLCQLGDAGPALCCNVGQNGGTCTDALSDRLNCGACGRVCDGGCVAGRCE